MKRKKLKLRVGWRTLKTAVAVILAMAAVNLYGTTESRLIFAMLGAMAAVQPTFKESLKACLAEIVGVLFGAAAGILLLALKLPPLVATGIGIVLVITLYNLLGIRFSPSLPCFILVMLCVSEDVRPIPYAVGRVWDTTIGLTVGMAINSLVFPYDNSRQIRATVRSLDVEVLAFLEDMFDGDDHLPDPERMAASIDALAAQLKVFSNQRLWLHLRRQKQELAVFKDCSRKARELLARMEVLSHMGRPGRLNHENRARLKKCGAQIRDSRVLEGVTERDVVTNYHVAQILKLRRELLKALEK